MSASGLQQAAKRLTAKSKGFEPVKTVPNKGARPGERSTGRPSASTGQTATATGSFEESDFALRTYWGPAVLTSSDGIFTIEVEPIKSIALTGGGVFNFQAPP